VRARRDLQPSAGGLAVERSGAAVYGVCPDGAKSAQRQAKPWPALSGLTGIQRRLQDRGRPIRAGVAPPSARVTAVSRSGPVLRVTEQRTMGRSAYRRGRRSVEAAEHARRVTASGRRADIASGATRSRVWTRPRGAARSVLCRSSRPALPGRLRRRTAARDLRRGHPYRSPAPGAGIVLHDPARQGPSSPRWARQAASGCPSD